MNPRKKHDHSHAHFVKTKPSSHHHARNAKSKLTFPSKSRHATDTCSSLVLEGEEQETSEHTASNEVAPLGPRGQCPEPSRSTSHTQYFKRNSLDKEKFDRIDSDLYCGARTESISGSSDTFHCDHWPKGKQYSPKGQLKRNLVKELDPQKKDPNWNDKCPPTQDVENLAKTLTFILRQPKGIHLLERIIEHLHDFTCCTREGYHVNLLDDVCVIFEYLVENYEKTPELKKHFVSLLETLAKPIILNVNSDVITKFDTIRDFIAYLGYLMMEVTDDSLFDLVASGLMYHMACPDKLRPANSVRLRHTVAAARQVLVDPIVHNIALARSRRFLPFLHLATILASDHEDNCVDFMKKNIIECIFYRFNPYFPHRDLPVYDINPVDVNNDVEVVLGDCSIHMSTTLTLLLILLKTAKDLIDQDRTFKAVFPYPDEYSQRCFVWAYRYECRRREHNHERITLTVIANAMLYIFREKLCVFFNQLMPDVMALSVNAELPSKHDWTSTVHIGKSIQDGLFKKTLIQLSANFLKTHNINRFMAESQHWVQGLMYLVDPALTSIRKNWDSVLFAELRKISLQALVVTMGCIPHDIALKISMLRRLLWYVEWYSESPYEISLLYWTVRAVHLSMYQRSDPARLQTIKQLFKTHGIIIFMHLCDTLMNSKYPPMEINQTVLGSVLRMLTSSIGVPGRVTCLVYPEISWPTSVNKLVRDMLKTVNSALKDYYTVSDRWLVALMNFVWEAIVWNKCNRDKFLANKGIYDLLDIITMCRYPVQCITLAVICDIVRAGDGVGQLITWRASLQASCTHPLLVKRGATIATLIAALCKKDFTADNIRFDENNVIQDLEYTLMSPEMRKYIFGPEVKYKHKDVFCAAAVDLMGSRTSKCYAILQMLSEDLKYKVDLADESYHLYKDVVIKPPDECILLLCSYFLTLKHMDVWLEMKMQTDAFLPEDNEIVNEFLHIGRGWAKYIQQQQLEIVDRYNEKQREKERSLYAFLERVRLNTALDALLGVRCIARSSDRNCIAHARIFEAVRDYHHRAIASKKLTAPVMSTYEAPLDESNTLGLNLKIINIPPKHHPKKREIIDTVSGSPHDRNRGSGDAMPDPGDDGGDGEVLHVDSKSSKQSGLSDQSDAGSQTFGGVQ